MMKFAKELAALMLMGIVIGLSLDAMLPYDDTDDPPYRSGFTVKRDALTGCEYLVRLFFVVPRMDDNGKQVCRKK